jgi:polyvinyl alcohol dehydrogenase (cytochrome)
MPTQGNLIRRASRISSLRHEIAGLAAAILALTLPQTTYAQDAAAIFAERCAVCHDHATGRTPPRAYLLPRLPSEIVHALSRGVMRRQAEGLSIDQMGALAVYLTGRPLDSEPDAKANACPANAPAAAPKTTGWPQWGGTASNTRFQPDPGFSVGDLPRLKVKWAFALPGLTGGPIAAGNMLYVASRLGRVIALDAATGCTRWAFETGSTMRSAVAVGVAGGTMATFFGDQNADIRALDAATGRLLWQTRADPYPGAMIVGAPSYHDGRLYVPVTSNDEADALDPKYPCCKFRGGVVALNAADGTILWRGYMIEQEPKPTRVNSAGTQMFGPSGGGVWSAPTIDPKRGLVYAASGNGDSGPVADGTDAVVAFDIDTGRRVWASQALPQDIWLWRCDGKTDGNCPSEAGVDFDFTSPPMLQTAAAGHQMLVAGSKSGIVWAFDPDANGKLLWQSRIAKGGPGAAIWGLAADKDNVFAAIPGPSHEPPNAPGGMAMLALTTGKTAWHTPGPTPPCAWGAAGCEHRQPAAVTAIPGAIFSGSLDGHLRAYAVADGKILWDMDTATTYDAVNGIKAYGGNIDGSAQIVANGTLFVNSGNATATSPRRGDAVLAITVDGK